MTRLSKDPHATPSGPPRTQGGYRARRYNPAMPDPPSSSTRAAPEAAGAQDSAGLEMLRRLAKVDRYSEWIFEQFRPVVGQRVLDLGCGIGNNTQFFLDRELVIAVDLEEEALREIEKRFGERPNFRAQLLDILDPDASALAAEGIDTVFCSNVLEHIEDDVRALHAVRRILRPGGRLLLLVPAFQFLYGTVDAALEHCRRYSKRELKEKLMEAGFQLESLRYMNLLGMVAWFIDGRILRKRVIPDSHYSFYNKLVPVLAKIERMVRPPVGLSLIAVARKPEDDAGD